jgi:hypothetical protein
MPMNAEVKNTDGDVVKRDSKMVKVREMPRSDQRRSRHCV